MGLVKRLSFMRLLFMRLSFINHRSPTDVSNVPGDSSLFCVLPGLRAITLGLLIFSMHIGHRLAVFCGTALIFLLTLVANEWIFRHS
jgi:hypothetical protein